MTPARTKILKYLQQGRTLTPLQSLQKFGSMSLSQHIGALKRRGHKIGSYIKPGCKFAVYYWIKG